MFFIILFAGPVYGKTAMAPQTTVDVEGRATQAHIAPKNAALPDIPPEWRQPGPKKVEIRDGSGKAVSESARNISDAAMNDAIDSGAGKGPFGGMVEKTDDANAKLLEMSTRSGNLDLAGPGVKAGASGKVSGQSFSIGQNADTQATEVRKTDNEPRKKRGRKRDKPLRSMAYGAGLGGFGDTDVFPSPRRGGKY